MKYYVKQKVFSLKDKFFVTDSQQNNLYIVKGKMFSLTNQLELMNMNEEVLLSASKRLFTVFPKFTVVKPNGEIQAIIKKVFGFRPKFNVMIGNESIEVQGSIFAHSFKIMKNGVFVASISKKIMSIGDSYEIDIQEKNNELLYLFIVIIIDQTIHENKNRSN